MILPGSRIGGSRRASSTGGPMGWAASPRRSSASTPPGPASRMPSPSRTPARNSSPDSKVTNRTGGQTSGVQRAAVIDMGSNSFRLVVYGYQPEDHWQQVDEIREAVRVGEGVRDDGMLQPEPMDRAVRVSKVFSLFCRASAIDDVTAVATSAIRDAPNGRELLDRIGDEAQVEARVLSDQEEARYGYIAIANSTTPRTGYGFDIGGGSVQIMRIEDRRLERAGSWPLGAVRMSERFLPGEEASGKDMKALRKHVRSVLEKEDWIEPVDPARA